jgi:hypothetical protein
MIVGMDDEWDDPQSAPARQQELASWQAAADLLSADLLITTGLDWSLVIETMRWDFDDDDLDSTWLSFSYGPVTTQLPAGDVPVVSEATAELADLLQEAVMEHFERPWPECPVHRRPMEPEPTGPTGSWVCGRDPAEAAAIGRLGPWLAVQGGE